jgi:hypothetical protein
MRVFCVMKNDLCNQKFNKRLQNDFMQPVYEVKTRE